jgi:hypothetical protein
MMNYKEIQTKFMDVTKKHIIIDNEDGSYNSFPADEANPEYIVFLAQLEGKQPELLGVTDNLEAPEAD